MNGISFWLPLILALVAGIGIAWAQAQEVSSLRDKLGRLNRSMVVERKNVEYAAFAATKRSKTPAELRGLPTWMYDRAMEYLARDCHERQDAVFAGRGAYQGHATAFKEALDAYEKLAAWFEETGERERKPRGWKDDLPEDLR